MFKRLTIIKEKIQSLFCQSRVFPPILLWILVAIYTLLLPEAIILYRFIRDEFGIEFAGKVPIFLVLIFGIAYVVTLNRLKISLKNLAYLIPCAIIALIIFTSVSNPNKHIHIPEYVLLSWLIYVALSRDYQGKGIFILVFICTSLLGVVDELEQGIHPGRFYGLGDMLVNSASALIGIFTIMGLRKVKATNWDWMSNLKDFKGFLWLILFGFIGVILMCTNLFLVQAQEGIFRGVYPEWLLVWHVLFLVVTPGLIFFSRSTSQIDRQKLENNFNVIPKNITVQLWIFPVLIILFYMQLLLVYVSIFGVNFK